jgi:hypothetical protein
MVLLQIYVPGLWSETCPSPSPDGNGSINLKSEEVSDVKGEEDPVPIPFPGIKAEHEVSCTSVCPLLGTFHTCP